MSMQEEAFVEKLDSLLSTRDDIQILKLSEASCCERIYDV